MFGEHAPARTQLQRLNTVTTRSSTVAVLLTDQQALGALQKKNRSDKKYKTTNRQKNAVFSKSTISVIKCA
jgi:hypothetical protein